MSRLLQRKAVHSTVDVAFEDIDIKRTKEGKPYLATPLAIPSFPHFNFNVSHHGSYVTIVTDPLLLVGVDVMCHDDRRSKPPKVFFESFREYLTEFEWETINSVGPDQNLLFDQFYRHWCMKEAYIKAVGIGLGFDLRRIEFRYGSRGLWGNEAIAKIDGSDCTTWRFFLDRMGTDHWVCVARGPLWDAIPSSGTEIRKENISFKDFQEALNRPETPFRFVSVRDLVPESFLKNYDEIVNNSV